MRVAVPLSGDVPGQHRDAFFRQHPLGLVDADRVDAGPPGSGEHLRHAGDPAQLPRSVQHDQDLRAQVAGCHELGPGTLPIPGAEPACFWFRGQRPSEPVPIVTWRLVLPRGAQFPVAQAAAWFAGLAAHLPG